jgi:Tfp pilus assembly protein PilF
LEVAIRHHQAGELQQAEAAYRQVLALQPDQPEALHFLGILCYQTGRLQEAAAHLAKATQLRPEQAAFHSNLGAVYQALGKLEAAIGCYSQAVALQPDHLQALFNLGLCHFQLGQYDQAELYYRQALAPAAPGCPDPDGAGPDLPTEGVAGNGHRPSRAGAGARVYPQSGRKNWPSSAARRGSWSAPLSSIGSSWSRIRSKRPCTMAWA